MKVPSPVCMLLASGIHNNWLNSFGIMAAKSLCTLKITEDKMRWSLLTRKIKKRSTVIYAKRSVLSLQGGYFAVFFEKLRVKINKN